MATRKTASVEISIPQLQQETARFRIIGTAGLIQERMSEKAKRTLLLGGGKKTAAQKLAIKHNPPEEFRDSAEIMKSGPTALGIRATAIKGAMSIAALEVPGVTKTKAYKLIYIGGELLPVYGTPQLRMDVVRSADQARTPDIRTRAYLPRWGAEIVVTYVVPQFHAESIARLLAAAGLICGLGGFRQEKGKGSFGTFRVLGTADEDPEWDDLVQNHGRAAQEAALAEPECADGDTEYLMDIFRQEQKRRSA